MSDSNLYFLPKVKERYIAVCYGVSPIEVTRMSLVAKKIEILFLKKIERKEKITKAKIKKLIEITEREEGYVVEISIPD